jgi:hypothetical protein
MKWKTVGVALAAAAIGLAVPISAHADNNGRGNQDPAGRSQADNSGRGNPSPPGRSGANPPGQSVASVARNGGGPSGVLGVLQSLHPQAPGLTTALSHVPTSVPPTRTTETESSTEPTETESSTEPTETETEATEAENDQD